MQLTTIRAEIERMTLKTAEVDLANLAHSLIQHAEDSVDLLDTGIVGVFSRLEADGTNPETLAGLHKVIVARKKGMQRIHNIVICDENGNSLAASDDRPLYLGDREYFQHQKQSTARDVFVAHPINSKLDDEGNVAVLRRFNHPDGSFAGVVVASISTRYFCGVLSAIRQWHRRLGGARDP